MAMSGINNDTLISLTKAPDSNAMAPKGVKLGA